jgi:hypothetical protein
MLGGWLEAMGLSRYDQNVENFIKSVLRRDSTSRQTRRAFLRGGHAFQFVQEPRPP